MPSIVQITFLGEKGMFNRVSESIILLTMKILVQWYFFQKQLCNSIILQRYPVVIALTIGDSTALKNRCMFKNAREGRLEDCSLYSRIEFTYGLRPIKDQYRI